MFTTFPEYLSYNRWRIVEYSSADFDICIEMIWEVASPEACDIKNLLNLVAAYIWALTNKED